jgi:hypothetical protein
MSGREINQVCQENTQFIVDIGTKKGGRAKERHCYTSCSGFLAMRPWTCEDKVTDNRMSAMRCLHISLKPSIF